MTIEYLLLQRLGDCRESVTHGVLDIHPLTAPRLIRRDLTALEERGEATQRACEKRGARSTTTKSRVTRMPQGLPDAPDRSGFGPCPCSV